MVRIYSIKQCSYCNELKELLKSNNIEFKDIDIDLKENQEEFNKINLIAKTDSVPIILVNKRILVVNKSYKTIQEAFELIKKFLNS